MMHAVTPSNLNTRIATSLSHRSLHKVREQTIHTLFAGGFPYSRKLSRHTSCVNALAFSRGDGRWLATGGDDMIVNLWDVHQDPGDINVPACAFTGPTANIFALEFSADNQYLFTGGVDAKIFMYDVPSAPGTGPGSAAGPNTHVAVRVFTEHTSHVRAVSCPPASNIVFSCAEDGAVLMHDTRVRQVAGSLQLLAEATGVQAHPLAELPHVFVTSDARGRVCVRDVRTFGKPDVLGVVRTFNTMLSKPSTGWLSNPEASSIVFSRDGSMLAVTMLHFRPTIYSLSDSEPIATCSGTTAPGGTPIPAHERTYLNSCTIKHGSFGGPGLDSDAYYAAGSDDFRGYVWRVPNVETLLEMRRKVCVADWVAEPSNTVGFAKHVGADRYVPVHLSTPLFRLNGHRSIVNSVLMHPSLPHIVTAGVERHVVLHGPYSAPGLTATDTAVRALPLADEDARQQLGRALRWGMIRDEGDDFGTVAVFDELLRAEGDGDIFSIRQRGGSSDSEESDSP